MRIRHHQYSTFQPSFQHLFIPRCKDIHAVGMTAIFALSSVLPEDVVAFIQAVAVRVLFDKVIHFAPTWAACPIDMQTIMAPLMYLELDSRIKHLEIAA
jgi:hypothetical protein